MNEIKKWDFNGQQVRTVEIEGEPYFVGKDVAEILGYKNTKDALAKHVDDDDKQVIQRSQITTLKDHIPSEVFPVKFVPADVPNRGLTVINESGVYSLVFGSKLPTAKAFKHWVTSEVLPALRRTGSYYLQGSYQIKDPIKRAQRWIEEQQARAQLEMQVAVQSQQIQELQPKASYYDVVLNCKDLLAISTIAKDYGKSAKWLNQYLHEKGVQYRQGEIWLLYQRYAEQGYTSTKTYNYNGTDGQQHAKVHTHWTQKGRLFIYDLLKKDGIVPVMEQGAAV